ncbi:MAG TPA: ribose-phosphate pyrophosphokinase, partial [Longimicrobiales bacterium]|nr:ribose-phosphate pyrophosphokinase [Longimicrobiales bacterium]
EAEGLIVFGGTASTRLSKRICDYLQIAPGKVKIGSYPDGETLVKVEEDVRGKDCFVVQSTCPPVNDNLMELLIFIDSLRRASAKRITAVIPYYGYARQDRKSEGRMPITAKLVANMLATSGADRVLAMNLHADQIQGFFDIPVDHLYAAPVLTKYFRDLNLPDPVVVAPDVGSAKMARGFAKRLGASLAIIDKRRPAANVAEVLNVVGDVDGKTCLLADDMVDTGGTLASAVFALRDRGAKAVYACATHALLSGQAAERLAEAPLEEMVVTNTIHVPEDRHFPNLRILSVADLLAKAIEHIHSNESVSKLFEITPDS